jgi:hypothetical protein
MEKVGHMIASKRNPLEIPDVTFDITVTASENICLAMILLSGLLLFIYLSPSYTPIGAIVLFGTLIIGNYIIGAKREKVEKFMNDLIEEGYTFQVIPHLNKTPQIIEQMYKEQQLGLQMMKHGDIPYITQSVDEDVDFFKLEEETDIYF